MRNKLDDAFNFQQQAINILSRRQDVLASNIANADTPGFQARDIDFSQQLKRAVDNTAPMKPSVSLSMTANTHMAGKPMRANNDELLYRIPDQPSADGNTVDMDRERINFTDNAMKYQSGLTFLGGDIKKMMAALSQG